MFEGDPKGKDGVVSYYTDLYRPMDRRQLTDHVVECITAEIPFADAKRAEELAHKTAREEFLRASNAGQLPRPPPFLALPRPPQQRCSSARRPRTDQEEPLPSSSTTTNGNPSSLASASFVRIEGGRPVTYYGERASYLAQRAAESSFPRTCGGSVAPHPPSSISSVPQIPRYVEGEGILIDKEQTPRPFGKRRVRPPTAPSTLGRPPATSGLSIAGVGASREEVGVGSGGPRQYHRTYHHLSSTTEEGKLAVNRRKGDGEKEISIPPPAPPDIIFYDRDAMRIPTKAERIRVMKATLPNINEEAARARMQRSQSAFSPRFSPADCAAAPTASVWKRPNYPYAWMREEARKDDVVYKSALRQKKERLQRRQQARVNLNADYAKLKGAALSVSSPRYLLESARKAEAEKEAKRAERLEKLWSNTEERYIAERADEERLREAAEGPSARGAKKLSSKMRREIMAVFERVGLSPR